MQDTIREKLILELYDNQMIKFGKFILKSGTTSYIYADIRSAIAYPVIFKIICDLFYKMLRELSYDFICGVPYSALTFASGIAYGYSIPMLLKRKEVKEYGTKKILEGKFEPGQLVLVLEDVVTTGSSIMETIKILEEHNLVVQDICFLIDRNQGGTKMLKDMGYSIRYIMDMKDIVNVLYDNGRITNKDKTAVLNSLCHS